MSHPTIPDAFGNALPGRHEFSSHWLRAYKLLAASQAELRCRRLRQHSQIVVAAGGCFDLLHLGHVRLLQRARFLGDTLIVCVNNDASVRQLKGPGRPLLPLDERLEMLAALAAVDNLVVFDGPTPERLLEMIRPSLWIKGGDYETAALPERAVVEKYGGKVVVLPELASCHTTSLVRRLNPPGEGLEEKP